MIQKTDNNVGAMTVPRDNITLPHCGRMEITMKKIAILILAVIFCGLLPVGVFADSDHVVINDILSDAVQFSEGNGNYYKIFDNKVSWQQAKLVCEGMGGHLATITSKEENEFCYSVFVGSKATHCWLGATDAESEGNWKWVTDEPLEYKNFAKGEPNGGKNANALKYYSGYNSIASGLWDDTAGSNKNVYMCEWEAEDISAIRSNYSIVNSAKKSIFNGAMIYNGHIYKVFTEFRSWNDAKTYCESLGGHLATVTSAEEDAALYSYLVRTGEQNCYLGATDAQTEGVWKWVTGERWDYANWKPAEPNGKKEQNWLIYYNTIETGEWDDSNGNKWFMCEWDYACIRADGGIGEHSFGETEVISEASCKDYGFGVHTCNECGISEWIQTEKQEHTYGEWVDITKVSCTLDGEQQKTCTVCGKTETQTIPAITHSFGEWKEVSGSKIFPPIVSERICSHCGEIETQEDMSTWWIIPAIVGGLIVGIIGVVGYIKAYK